MEGEVILTTNRRVGIVRVRQPVARQGAVTKDPDMWLKTEEVRNLMLWPSFHVWLLVIVP